MSQTCVPQNSDRGSSVMPTGQPLPLLIKILDCLFAGIAVVDFYNSLVLYPAMFVPALSKYLFIFRSVNALVTFVTIAFVIIFPILWHRRERKGVLDAGVRHAWLLGIIRYWLAVEIFNYAFAKILGTQFAPSYFKGESTWNSLSGLDLTWNYFSYSYTMSVIIGVIQIVGSALLLFRRTILPGVILLLPVMVNIVLIDVFYSIPYGALANAILFTLGLSYLLLLQWQAVKTFFIQSVPRLPAIRLWGLKNLLRLALAAYAFAFIYHVTTTRAPEILTGKWKIDQLVRNGDTARVNDWLTDSLSWKNIYLEEYGRATFSPNPYLVETKRVMTGTYKYEEPKKTIDFSLHAPGSAIRPFYAIVIMPAPGHMEWKLIGGNDTAFLLLTKTKEELHHQ